MFSMHKPVPKLPKGREWEAKKLERYVAYSAWTCASNLPLATAGRALMLSTVPPRLGCIDPARHYKIIENMKTMDAAIAQHRQEARDKRRAKKTSRWNIVLNAKLMRK